ncbi:MAG: hypothetical protein KC656_09325, partial [Myxococcales bacterium]|nr:hypothetical protein [Myxococcales bacterium]
RVRLSHERLWAEVHGGRRAISTSRRNVGGFLPAAGLDVGYTGDRVVVDGSVAWSEDRLFVGGTGVTQDVGGLTGQLRATVRPNDTVLVGAHTSFTQGDTYAIGPTWADGVVEAQALGLFQASGWGSWSPSDPVRLDVDVLHQNVQSWSVGLVDESTDAIVRPRFTDVRAKLRLGPPKVGWLEPSVRYRVRPDRTEVRMQLRFDVNDLVVPGLYLRTRGAFDDIHGEGQAQDVGSRDRTFGAASLGWRKDGFDGSLGASYVQRGAKPVSSRTTTSTTSDDLMPFVLEADPIASARVFYSGKRWFSGLDVEKHLSQDEVRALLQIGVLTEVGW